MKWSELSKKKKAYIIGFGALTLVMFWAFFSAMVITRNLDRSKLSTDANRQEASINGIILTETKDRTKYWEMYGETGEYDSKNEIAMMDNVVGNFYKDNDVSMSFQSTKGTYNAAKKIIVLYQDTFIVMKDKTTLKADRLRYAGNDVPITAHGNVRITRGNSFLATAEEVEIAPDFDSFKIIGKTTSKIYEEKK